MWPNLKTSNLKSGLPVPRRCDLNQFLRELGCWMVGPQTSRPPALAVVANHLFRFLKFVPEVAGIRRPVVRIGGQGKEDLRPRPGLVGGSLLPTLDTSFHVSARALS